MLEVKVTTLPAHVLNNRNNLHHLQVDFRCCASAALWKPDGDAAAAVCQSPAHSPVSGFHARVNTAAKQQLSRIFSHRESYGCTLRMAFCFSALINVSFPSCSSASWVDHVWRPSQHLNKITQQCCPRSFPDETVFLSPRRKERVSH